MKINLDAIIQIESSGLATAFNPRSDARGLCQITPKGALADWNRCHPNETRNREELFDPEINKKIALWYLEEQIPAMLKAYGMPVSLTYILGSYNWGIGKMLRYWTKEIARLPEETADYIKKYEELTRK